MRIPRSITVAAALLTAACGSASSDDVADREPVSSTPADTATLDCVRDRDRIVELLSSGLPTYDYEPRADLTSLVGATDVTVSGELHSIVRGPAPVGPDVEQFTVIDIAASEEIYPTVGATDISLFGMSSSWPTGVGDDPIGEPVRVIGVEFVASLEEWRAAPGGYAVDIQGFGIACGPDDVVTSIIEPFPPDVLGSTLAELTDRVRAVAAQRSDDTSSSTIDGPVIRYPAPDPLAAASDAAIVGALTLDDGCLRLDDAYPVVWPATTEWDDATDTVVLPNGERVAIGDAIEGGGGYGPADNVATIAGDEARDLAARCVRQEFGEVAFINNIADELKRLDR